jgi:hypothetical protein
VAVLDINGDTWPDLVAGTCTGIVVYINVPPMNITFAYPDGLPTTAAPGVAKSFRVQQNVVGGTAIADSTRLFWSVDGGAFQSAVLPSVGANLFQATLPGFQCGQAVRFYVTATLDNGIVFNDPATAPAITNPISVQSGNTQPYSNDMEASTSDWTVINEGGLTTGGWQVATPIGTTSGVYAAAPAADASAVGTKAWVTQNGLAGGAATTADVDGGTTRLVSPVFDLSTAANATVTYSRWYFCSDAAPAGSTPAEVDVLFVEISTNGGATWGRLENVSSYPVPNAWNRVSFSLRSVVPNLTSTMRFRFSISDSPDNSTTEVGIDDFSISAVTCVNPCLGDLDGNGVVNGADLGSMLAAWGTPGNSDLDGNGDTNGADLGTLLSAWGICP